MRRLALVVLLAAPVAAQDLYDRELLPFPGEVTASELLDLDFDGRADLLLALSNVQIEGSLPSQRLAVARGDGRGGFGAPTFTDVPSDPYWAQIGPLLLQVGDLDEDGVPDAFIANRANGDLGIPDLQTLLGDGHGGFVSHQVLLDPNLFSSIATELADFDGDGHLDGLVADQTNYRVFRGNGAGDLDATSITTVVPLSVGDEAVAGDLDGDGALDLAVNTDVAFVLPRWLRGDGAGGFAPPVELPSGIQGARDFALDDFDADGAVDVAVACSYVFTADGGSDGEILPFLRVLRGHGDGSFDAGIPFDTPPYVSELRSADMDGDGRPDLVSLHAGSVVVTFDPLGPPPGDDYGPPFGGGPPANSLGDTLALADIDSDGRPDAVTAGQIDHEAFALRLLNDGTGLFESPPSYPAPGGKGALLADVDGDGRPDAVVALEGGYEWMAGDAAGGFAPGQPLPTSPAASSLAFADFSADGVPDIATANGATHDLSVLLADGRGGYTDTQPGGWPWFGWNKFPAIVQAADLDGDGRPDIIVTKGSQPPLTLLRASGPGTFFPPEGFGSLNEPGGILRLADMDDDGVLDLVVGRIWLNDGTAHFTPGAPIDDDVNDLSILGATALGDMNADGHLDTVFSGDAAVPPTFDFSPLIDVRLGDGAGGLSPSALWFTAAHPSVHAVADLDGDGQLDAVGTRSAAFGDGAGSFTGLRSWAANISAVSDLDGDGRPDLLAFDTQNEAVQALLHLPTPFTWSDLGHGLAGAHGAPQLGGHGALSIGSAMEVHVDALPHDTLLTLILGAAQLGAPFKGGVLVPSPDRVVAGLPSGPDGFLSLAGTWPPGLPAEVELFLQAWVPDATAPQGWAASNALKLSPP